MAIHKLARASFPFRPGTLRAEFVAKAACRMRAFERRWPRYPYAHELIGVREIVSVKSEVQDPIGQLWWEPVASGSVKVGLDVGYALGFR